MVSVRLMADVGGPACRGRPFGPVWLTPAREPAVPLVLVPKPDDPRPPAGHHRPTGSQLLFQVLSRFRHADRARSLQAVGRRSVSPFGSVEVRVRTWTSMEPPCSRCASKHERFPAPLRNSPLLQAGTVRHSQRQRRPEDAPSSDRRVRIDGGLHIGRRACGQRTAPCRRLQSLWQQCGGPGARLGSRLRRHRVGRSAGVPGCLPSACRHAGTRSFLRVAARRLAGNETRRPRRQHAKARPGRLVLHDGSSLVRWSKDGCRSRYGDNAEMPIWRAVLTPLTSFGADIRCFRDHRRLSCHRRSILKG